MADNTLQFLAESLQKLDVAGIKAWLFGGWAEELAGVRAPGPHNDIDLLYPANDFTAVEEFIREKVKKGEAEEINAKKFIHKRAFVWNGVCFEIFLVRQGTVRNVTEFFGLYRLEWPADTLNSELQLFGDAFRIASVDALRKYRQDHALVQEAYRRFLREASIAPANAKML